MWSLYLIKPSWFCFGVERAINLLEEIINKHKWEKIYCVHEIVHNPNVVNYFRKKWINFVEKIEDIEDKNSIVIFSAHWVDKFILDQANKVFKKVYNLACPLVEKVYKEGEKFVKEWKIIFYIWKQWHQEAENIVSYLKKLWAKVYMFLKKEEIPNLSYNSNIWILSQTTLNFSYVMNLINYIKTVIQSFQYL